jgi:hypothetical protein
MSYRPLALDLATTTGWALHQPGLERPFFGAIKLPGRPRDIGARMEALRVFLADKHAIYKPTDYLFEAQHVPMPKKLPGGKWSGPSMDIDTLAMLLGLGAMVEWFAHRVGARCFKVHISEWRKHFIGRGSGFGATGAKEMAIRKCAEFGWHTDVADAAEACGILDFYMHLLAQADHDYAIPWRNKSFFGGLLDEPTRTA